MKLIKCFTESHVDNIASCLRLRPDSMVLVGNADDMREPIKRYRQVLKNYPVTDCPVDGKDLEEVCALWETLVRQEDRYIIDLTGGDALVVMAVGAMLAKLDPEKRQSIQVVRFDPDSNTILDCMEDQRKIPQHAVNLTITDLIALHGGKFLDNTYQPDKSCHRRDLAGLWNIVTEDPGAWNRTISMLNEFESRDDFKNHIRLPLQSLRHSIVNFEEKEDAVRALLGKFQREGIIDDRSTRQTLDYTYRSAMLRYCTMKAGNVLEVKSLLEGRAVMENGAPFFHDCRMSVYIDWDGIVHNSRKIPETRNEIDVVLMHDATPLFISCKNGTIEEEELYKLHTVATLFGGPYARKVLIATNLDRKNHALIQRAWDMDIFLVAEAAELSPSEWRKLFYDAMQ